MLKADEYWLPLAIDDGELGELKFSGLRIRVL
jgi:hypothetical protein